MKIAVNARALQPQYMEGIGNYTLQVTLQLARQLPNYTFVLFVDHQEDLGIDWPKNCTIKYIAPKTRHPLAWYYWFNVAVPLYLRKLKADYFISFDGFLSQTTSVKQILFIHDVAFLQKQKWINPVYKAYYKFFTPRFIKKAAHIFTVSDFSKQEIMEKYKVPAAGIDVLYNGVADTLKPLHWSQQNEVREKYTNHTMYFLYVGSIHPRKNLINLLKGFSQFKKWQKSNLKLVLAGRLAWKNKAFNKLLETYKYKEDVIVLGYLPNEALYKIMASAYALIYPSLYEGFGVPIIEAMRCDVPVIASHNSGMIEASGGAALPIDPTDFTTIGNQLRLVYKDEQLRNQLIKNGTAHALNFEWSQTVKPLVDYLKPK